MRVQGIKTLKCRVSTVSVLGSVIMVCGIYFMFMYLDPQGSVAYSLGKTTLARDNLDCGVLTGSA